MATVSSVTTVEESLNSPPTDNSFSSPATILPLVISLATLVTIIIVACILYRKRQNKRSQELARQLRVTERKIDAIGNLKAKKEQQLLGLANRKTEYHPPATAPCSSATSLESHTNVGRELEVRFVPSTQIKEEEEMTTSATEPMDYEVKLCEVSINSAAAQPPTSTAPSTFTNTQSNNDREEMEGSSSYYCSSCQGGPNATSTGWEGRRTKAGGGGGDSSMIVECETIPSASSLSTVIGTVLSQPNHMTRSQSEHHHVTRQPKPKEASKRFSAISAWSHHVQSYSHIVRNLRYSSKYKTARNDDSGNASSAPHAGTWGTGPAQTNTYSTITAPLVPPTTSYFGMTQSYAGSRTISSSRREEGSGRPNTPVSSVVTDLTTDTEGEKEKWV